MGAVDMPVKLGKKHRIGVGVLFNQESIGLYQNLGVSAQVSYKFKFLKGIWSVGVQPGYYNSKFKGSDVYMPRVMISTSLMILTCRRATCRAMPSTSR